MAIRVAIADDQPLVRDGFAVQLRLAEDMELVGTAGSGTAAVALARDTQPDVLLMDVRMPGLDGIEATARITADESTAGVRVLVLTTFDLDEYVYAALRAGVSGFLLKDVTPEDLLAAIRVVAAGEALLAPRVTTRLVAEFARGPAARPARRLVEGLTEREIEVLTLVGRGLSNTEIAEVLVVSPLTAKTHVSRILTKLGVRDRPGLVVIAYEAGLVVPGTS